MQFKILGTVWHTPVFCFTPSNTRRKKHGEEGRQAPEPQPEAGGTSKSWWNRSPFLRKERREKKGDPGGTRRSQQIMREQRPFLARIENPIQLKSCLGKNSSKQIIETANCHPVDAVDAVATSPRSRWNWGSSEVPNGHQMSHPSHQTTGIWPLCWWLEEKLHEIEAQNCVNCLVFHYDFKNIYILYIIYILRDEGEIRIFLGVLITRSSKPFQDVSSLFAAAIYAFWAMP